MEGDRETKEEVSLSDFDSVTWTGVLVVTDVPVSLSSVVVMSEIC